MTLFISPNSCLNIGAIVTIINVLEDEIDACYLGAELIVNVEVIFKQQIGVVRNNLLLT